MILANGCNITKSEKFKGGLNTFRTHCIYRDIDTANMQIRACCDISKMVPMPTQEELKCTYMENKVIQSVREWFVYVVSQ